MYLPKPTRSNTLLRQTAAAVLCGLLTVNVFAQGGGNHPNTPRNMPRRNPPPQRDGFGGRFGQPKGPHLQQWFAQRNSMTPQQREDALRREPGFRQMPPDAQQKAMNTLQRLNNMTPPQRQRFLARNEALERMTPDQRRQFRGAMQNLKSMAPDRRAVFARSFRELRQLPPDQRSAALNSPQYRSILNNEERRTLDLVLDAEPAVTPAPSQR